MKGGVLNRFRRKLPREVAESDLTLGEGDTPLVALNTVARMLGGGRRVFAKCEGTNPTGSFKDRGMAVAVAAAAARGAGCVVCASTGNTSASAAAYAARAGMACAVLIPAGKIAAGKLAQAVAHGARVLQIDGNFDDAMAAVRELEGEGDAAVVNSINPMRIQGQKTAAFEICEELGRAPAVHCLPVGNAGNITAYWLGYREHDSENNTGLPKMLGCQASGAAPFLRGGPVENAETRATAIRIGNPQSFEAAVAAARESGGKFVAVSDEEILRAQSLLASREGVFCEPASAASVAGLLAEKESGFLSEEGDVVCTLTGHGLKDTEVVAAAEPRVYAADGESIKRALGSVMGRKS